MKRKVFPLIIPILLSYSVILATAEMKTFVKEYTYQAGDIDSKITCRTIALEQVKRLLLEELGTYIENNKEVRNYQLTKDQIIVLAGGVVQTRLIEEKWDGKSYRIKVEITADPDDILKFINELREKRQLSGGLLEARTKADDALKEIERLKQIAKKTKSGRDKLELQKKYQEEVKKVDEYELEQREFDTLLNAALAHDKGNYDQAIYISKIILSNQRSSQICLAYILLGESYRAKGMYNEAIDGLNMALKLCSSPAYAPSAHEYLGRTLREMKLYEKAIGEFRKALSLLYDEKKRLENESPSKYGSDPLILEMKQSSRDIVDSQIAENHLQLFGVYVYIAGESVKPGTSSTDWVEIPKEAMPEVDKVLALKPNSMEHLRFIHKAGWGKFREIIAWCDKLAKLRPNDGEVYFIRGSN